LLFTGFVEDATDVIATRSDSRVLNVFEHSTDSLHRPMSDDALQGRPRGPVDPVRGADRAERLVQVRSRLVSQPAVRGIAARARP
jgi:hypothetical protein